MNEFGNKITFSNKKINVPDDPIIPFIEGDGIGPDIWKASVKVFNSAVLKAYGGEKKNYMERVNGRRKSI